MCDVLLPPGVNLTAVIYIYIYIYIYHILLELLNCFDKRTDYYSILQNLNSINCSTDSAALETNERG
jgi:hypothetical protein